MKNQLFALFALAIGLGFTTIGYSETVLSLAPVGDINAVSVGQQIKIDVKITGGENVATYAPQIGFDSTALKYIDAENGNYLVENGVWVSPEQNADGLYQIRVTVGETTTVGETVKFPPLPAGVEIEEAEDNRDTISWQDFLVPVRDLQEQVPDLEVPPQFIAPGTEYWMLSFLASSPLGNDTLPIPVNGDGTLATLIFEVVAEKSSKVVLIGANLSDPNDEALEATFQNDLITVNGRETSVPSSVDVNADGTVNILDLVFVASQFGESVTEANAAADVNADGKINIQDLVLVAQHLGN